jgi:UDP-arabinose 4-epimerase
MATFLVTGGAGYVGSHVCKALAGQGHTPVVYDNLSRGHRRAVKWGPLEEGCLHDRPRLDAVLRRWKPDVVLHFAAFAYVAESIADPALYYRNNVVGTLDLLDAMRAAGVGRLVFSSTCATYGVASARAIREDDPQNPINPYGATKLMIERILRDQGAAYGLNAIILRYFNAAGADPDLEIGEDHDPEPHAIPLAIYAAMGRTPAFRVLGTDYDTPDGSAVRDYVHVCDLAAAHLAAAARLLGGAAGVEAFNLGVGAGVSVLELVRAVERVSGRPLPVEPGPRRPGDPPRLVADSARAAAVLDWRPTQSGIDNLIGSAWRWHNR